MLSLRIHNLMKYSPFPMKVLCLVLVQRFTFLESLWENTLAGFDKKKKNGMLFPFEMQLEKETGVI